LRKNINSETIKTMCVLYIIATSIGNLEDMTFRAIRTLKECKLIIAEDTRHAQILLKKYDIKNSLSCFYAQSTKKKTEELIQKIKSQKSTAYISDAGTPCISDPGFRLIRRAIQENITIVPIPGASALTTFISCSGLPADNFEFHGFLPHKKGRQTIIKSILNKKNAQFFYESVHRLPKLLEELKKELPENRAIAIGKELTKAHETIFRSTIGEIQKLFTKENTKGEFVIGIAPEDFSFISKKNN